MDEKLEYFKKKILAHLDDLEQKENAEKKELKKSLLAFEMTSIEKAGYPVGTIREWKGKKYIKVAPGKWKPKYDSHSRGAKLAIAALKKKIDACTDSEELMQIILENRDRFSDENGRPLPFVKELSDYISGRNDAIESEKNEKKATDEKIKNHFEETKQSKQKNEPVKADSVKNALNNEEKVKFVNKLSGEVYHDYETDPSKFAVYAKDGKSKGLAMTQDIADIINSHSEASVYDWANAIAEDVNKKYPNIRKEYVKTSLSAIRMGYRNGDKEKVMILPDSKEEPKNTGFTLDDIRHIGDGKETKKVNDMETTIKDIRDKYEASKSVTGNKKTVTLPDGTKIKCHYKIVEAEAPTASHDERTFAPSKGFPTTKDGKSVNDRDYQNDADAQESVRKIASNFNSLALESPPIVTKDGIVISGNNRTMSSKLAARQGTDKAYLQDLREMADEYGIEPEDLNGFENPRLILETDNEHEGDYTTEEFAQFNRDTKKTMNNVEKAVKLTKTLNAEKIQSIAESLQGYDTMGELYADTKGSQEFVNKLISAGIIGENEKAQYCRTDGTLNDTGKDFCETVLVGGVLNEDNIRKLDSAGGKRIRQKLVRAILPLIENKGTGKEYSFNTELNDAVNIAVIVAKDHDTFPNVKTYLSQGNLFGEKEPDAATSRLAEIIHDEGEKAFAQRMKDLGAGLRASASGEQDIFLGGVESKESLLNKFLEIKKSITDILFKLGKREQSASEDEIDSEDEIKKAVADVLGELVQGDK